MRIGIGEIGMWIGGPGGLDDAGGLAQLAGLAEQPAGERGGRHQGGGEPDGGERQRAGAGAIGRLGGERLRGQEHGALARIGGLVDEAGPLVALQPIERAGPIAGGAAKVQHRMAGPGGRGGIARRFLGDQPRGRLILAALRLDEQAVQAEQPGVGAQRHRLEGALGAGTVAGELRGLRAQAAA